MSVHRPRRAAVLIITALLATGLVPQASVAGTTTNGAVTADGQTILIGAFVQPHSPKRETTQEELAWFEARIGNPEIRRVYDYAFSTDFMVRGGLDVGHRATHYSFKPDMAAMASGALDNQVRLLLDSIPAGHQTVLTIWHEPEDNFVTTAQKTTYRAAWQRFADLVHDTGRAELSTSLVLMAWTWKKRSGRDPIDWYAGDAYVDTVMIDTYNQRGFTGEPPNRRHPDKPAIRWIQERGVAWGVSEFGSPELDNDVGGTRSEKAKYIRHSVRYFAREGAAYVEYYHANGYHTGDFWLDTSRASVRAYRWAMETY